MATVSMKQMLEAGVHFGHQKHRWNPKMNRYIFTHRNGIHIIDLSQTVGLFNAAYERVKKAAAAGGRVLFVGTKNQAADIVAEEALRCDGFYVNHRWLGGTLTNWNTIKRSIERLRDLERMEEDGTFDLLTKKEALKLSRERDKLELNLGGIKNMKGVPSIVFVIDPSREQIAVREARRLNIDVIAITDTNCDPDMVDYPIPGNDDAIRSIKLFSAAIADAVIEGRESKRQEFDKDEKKADAEPAKTEGAPAEEAPAEEAAPAE